VADQQIAATLQDGDTKSARFEVLEDHAPKIARIAGYGAA